ncbi:hypothetical protein [Fusobacterium sp. MFO224]|uniref:hypothetical protein n=1 Tax=Fusobacterium sp. MFO224 TaxID=3378070 RepID=UPI0038545353
MKNAFEKYNIFIPKISITEFDTEDISKVLTYKIGKIIPIVLKDLDDNINSNNQFNVQKLSLIFKGKNDKRETHKMKNYIKEHIDKYDENNFNLLNILRDILENIIHDMLYYNKDSLRKNEFFNTLNNLNGARYIFIIGVICIEECFLEKYGYIKNGKYLELVLKAKKELRKEITNIYKGLKNGVYTETEVNSMFRALIKTRIKNYIENNESLEKELRFEKDLYKICDEESLEKYIYDITDSSRTKATNQPRLFSLS